MLFPFYAVALALSLFHVAIAGYTQSLRGVNGSSLNFSTTDNEQWDKKNDVHIKRFFHQRRQLVEAIDTEKEEGKKAWHALAEVDGLKNEDVAVLITSTSMDGEIYLWER